MIVDHIIHDLSACPVQVINTWLPPSCQFIASMRPVFTINLLLASVLLTCVQTRTGAGGGKVGGGGGKLGSDILIPLILGPVLLTLLTMLCCWWCCRNSTRDVAGNITFRSPCWKGSRSKEYRVYLYILVGWHIYHIYVQNTFICCREIIKWNMNNCRLHFI